MSQPQIRIHQIFYDERSRALLDPGFIALDNTDNARPDWYEFWVIKRYLESHTLEDGAWYGFFSPKFGQKTGLRSADLKQFLVNGNDQFDVAFIATAFDQLAYFRNPFEQGEFWHPGISQLSQQVLDAIGCDVRIDDIVSHSYNFTFSNFIVAKPEYWRRWLEFAKRLFDFIEHSAEPLAQAARQTTSYGSVANQAPLKTFIQERLPCVLMAAEPMRCMTIEDSVGFPIFNRVFAETKYTRALLQTCNLLKAEYSIKKDPTLLDAYLRTRQLIQLHPGFQHPGG
jgi:hypothetical protein